MRRRLGATAAAAVLVAAASCGSSPSSNLTGFGATTAAWNAAHKSAPDYAGYPAYGPLVETPQGRVPQFTEVQTTNGRVSQYIEALPKNTSVTAAMKAARANLPSSAVAKSFVVTTSCAFWNLTDDALLPALGSNQVAVEMAYDDTSGSPYWMPESVNTLTFQTGRGDSTDVC